MMPTFTVSADPNYQKRKEAELVNATIEYCAQRIDALVKATDTDVVKTAFEEAAAAIRALIAAK